MTLLEVEQLAVHYRRRTLFGGTSGPPVRAVDGVSFSVERGETVGLVGESGCGKSTVARAIVGLVQPTSGEIRIDGRSVVGDRPRQDRKLYRRQVQMIFQDPFDSLNPRKRVLETIAQPLRLHSMISRANREEEVVRLLETVGLTPARQLLRRLPHEFSGGQRQRLGIARALAVGPQLIVADEPVSALDVSIRAQILALLQDLQVSMGLSYLFISHDLGIVRALADRVMVMYLGQIVEEGPTAEVLRRPRHPYTAALLTATPVIASNPKAKRVAPIAGEVPSNREPPSGCRFRTRCPFVAEICQTEPPRQVVGMTSAKCHFASSPDWDPVRDLLAMDPAEDAAVP